MKKLALILLFFLAVATGFFIVHARFTSLRPFDFTQGFGRQAKPLPLLKYTFENLKNTKFSPSPITLGEKVTEISQKFYFDIPEKVSGLINFPDEPGTYPVIVMFRGYIPKETYQPGAGSQPSAKVLAANGFITLAPDFLGYAESTSPSATPFEERFQTTTTALTLLASLENLNSALPAQIKADLSKVGIWGHSNGGSIALSVLAISGGSYPTVLWAPVSKSFPYSILAYTDETDDQGKYLRRALADFEKDYNTEDFSPPKYFSWIKAPLLINQGLNDQEVPYWWSDELVKNLKSYGLEVKYLKYPGADHNFLPSGWNQAITNTVAFFKDKFR